MKEKQPDPSDRYVAERFHHVTHNKGQEKVVVKFTVFDRKIGRDLNLMWDTYADAQKYADHFNVPALRNYIVRAI